MNKVKYILIVLSVLNINGLLAQPGGKVPDQSQDVVKNFDAKLLESEKVKINPQLPPIDTTTKAQTYSVPNMVLKVDYQPPRMRPIAMPAQKLPPQYNGFAKLGYGLPNSPYGELAYRFGDPKQYLVGIKGKYHAAEDKKVENQLFSKTEVEGSGTFYARAGIAVDAKLGIDNSTNHYYGYNFPKKDTTFTREAVGQKFDNFYAAIKAYNSARTVADFNYSLGLSFNSLGDNFSSKETDFNIRLDATKWFSEKHPLSLTLRTDFTGLDTTDAGNRQTLNNIYLQPNFTFKSDIFSIRLGANLMSHNDIFYPKPDIEANINVAGSRLGIFAGAKGDLVKNSYRVLGKYNPYIYSRQKIRNTEVNEYYGGIKGNISGFNYSAQTGWSSNKNLALFLLDTADARNRFRVLYDTVNIFNIRGAITMNPIKDLELTATVSQNIYSAKKQERAWGLPSLDVNIAAKYNVVNDPKSNTTAAVKASLFVQNGVNYKLANGQADRLGSLIDLSLGGELFFSKNIGVFLDANNVLNIKRQRWENYPTFGINILGGVTARF